MRSELGVASWARWLWGGIGNEGERSEAKVADIADYSLKCGKEVVNRLNSILCLCIYVCECECLYLGERERK